MKRMTRDRERSYPHACGLMSHELHPYEEPDGTETRRLGLDS
jgi:hypothetical protein